MMKVEDKCFYLFVEGAHDCAAVSRILKLHNFIEIQSFRRIPPFLQEIIPTNYPFDGNTLDRASHAPTILYRERDNQYVAVTVAFGDSKIAREVHGMSNIKMEYIKKIAGVGIILDADNTDMKKRKKDIISAINGLDADRLDDSSLSISEGKITIYSQDFSFSTYVMPNNKDIGTLEDVLLEGAEHNYQDLLVLANQYMVQIPDKYSANLVAPPSKRKKALVGVISNIMKPGKPNQASIGDCEWFTLESINKVKSHKLLYEFLNVNIGL